MEKMPVAPTQEVLGYKVRLTGNNEAPYELEGPRGGIYTLLRNVPKPYMLFVVGTVHYGLRQPKLKGYTWFTDRDGVLKPVG